MNYSLIPGIKGFAEREVTKDITALTVGSGGLDVLATAMMIALIEKAARESVQPYLDSGLGTVGTQVNVSHISATPVGMKFRAESELISIDGRKLTFSVAAYDEKCKIGEGTHERFIINDDKFMSKTYLKLEKEKK